MILAAQYKPLNLGQGFPDFAAPKYVTEALAQVAQSDNVLLHQYTRGFVSLLCFISDLRDVCRGCQS